LSGEADLLQEVFLLAYYLHWSRDDILNLPIPERHRYLTLLADQLHQERQTTENQLQ
jgi:hypothetical protein